MRWKIENEATIGVCLTNNHVRESSYLVVKSTKNKDTVMAVLPNKESAEKIFGTIMHDMRNEMTGKKEPVSADLILRKTVKHGTQVGRTQTGIRIRWDYEEISSERTEPISKYSGAYARRIAKRKV
jgi:hypothetical protein